MIILNTNLVLLLVIVLFAYTLYYTYSNDFGIFLFLILLSGVSYYIYLLLFDMINNIETKILNIESNINNSIMEIKSQYAKFENIPDLINKVKSLGSSIF